MAMRGDDGIGMIQDPATERLRFLKTEAKSRIDLRAQTLEEARAGLDKDDGGPSALRVELRPGVGADGTVQSRCGAENGTATRRPG